MPNRIVLDSLGSPIEIRRTFLRLPIDRYAAPNDRPNLGFISTKDNAKIFEIELLIDNTTKIALDDLYVAKRMTESLELTDDTLDSLSLNNVVFNAPPAYDRVGRLWNANLSFYEIGAGSVTVDGVVINLISELPLSLLVEFGNPIARSVAGTRILRDISFNNPRIFTIVGFVNNQTKENLEESFNTNRYLSPIVVNDQIETNQTYNLVWAKPPEFNFVQVGVWGVIITLETA